MRSIFGNMQTMELQQKIITTGKSGAKKEDWQKIENISISVFKNSDSISVDSVRYNNSTHIGFTFYKNICIGKSRLKDCEGNIYTITGTTMTGRLNNLMLKVVDTNV